MHLASAPGRTHASKLVARVVAKCSPSQAKARALSQTAIIVPHSCLIRQTDSLECTQQWATSCFVACIRQAAICMVQRRMQCCTQYEWKSSYEILRTYCSEQIGQHLKINSNSTYFIVSHLPMIYLVKEILNYFHNNARVTIQLRTAVKSLIIIPHYRAHNCIMIICVCHIHLVIIVSLA